MEKTSSTQSSWIKERILTYISSSPRNTMGDETGEPAWDNALVGFGSGADKMWQQYKEYIGAFHWTPWEIFNQYHPNALSRPEELTIISWVLPQREVVRNANRQAIKNPSPEWARVRVNGEYFNEELRRYVVQCLEEAGYPAVAPILTPVWSRVKSEQFSYASTWSERHVAHACGLGTFGLCDGLITPKGKAMRLGSVVAKVSIPATERPYTHHQAYCLFFTEGTCGKCIDRCPARAITESGHDKEKCRQYLAYTKDYIKKNFGFEGYGCGLCQVGVPCEASIPAKATNRA